MNVSHIVWDVGMTAGIFKLTDPVRVPPPLHSSVQVRGLNASSVTVRAFAADVAPATTEDAWAKVNEVVTTDEGKRAIAQLQKVMGDIREEVAREAKVSCFFSPSQRIAATRTADERGGGYGSSSRTVNLRDSGKSQPHLLGISSAKGRGCLFAVLDGREGLERGGGDGGRDGSEDDGAFRLEKIWGRLGCNRSSRERFALPQKKKKKKISTTK